MLTKEQILEVLQSYTQVLDDYLRGVTSWEYDAIADALLSLQEAPPEEAIPEGYITEECPPGYVAKEPPSGSECKGCAFDTDDWICNVPLSTPCAFVDRKDGKSVIFIRKEDAK